MTLKPGTLLVGLAFTLLVVAALSNSVAATSHGSDSYQEEIDPATDFLVCRNVMSSAYGSGTVSQCVGRCPGGNRTSYWRKRGAVGTRETPTNYACNGSCIRSASNGCNWVNVDYSRGSSYYGNPGETISCKTSSSNAAACRWYSDPFCSKSIDLASVKDDKISCWTNTTFTPGTWCGDAYDYLIKQKKPTECPDVTETQTIPPPWFGPWMCIRSCADKGNYVKVRRASQMATCLGPYSDGVVAHDRCSWYSDAKCSVLAPGEPEPGMSYYSDFTGGATCLQTTEGWCKLAADAVLRNLTVPRDCSNVTATPTASPQTTQTTTLTTPAPTQSISLIKGPWICVTSCLDKGNSIKIRRLTSPDGSLNLIMCQGPNDTSCSWYSDSKCTSIAPNEYAPSASGEEGVVCTQTTEGWCKVGLLAASGGTVPSCGTNTGLVTPTATASVTDSGTKPSQGSKPSGGSKQTVVLCNMIPFFVTSMAFLSMI